MKRLYYNHVKWKNYQWSGIYHITLVTNDRGSNIFGQIAGDSADTAHVQYTDLGKKVLDCIKAIPNHYPQENIVIEASAVMPDHLHFVLHIVSDLHTITFGQIINGLKIGINQALPNRNNAYSNRNNAYPNRNAVGSIHLTWQDREQLRGTGLLLQGFNCRILLPSASLETMINYVNDNPRRAWIKRHNRDLFTIKRNLSLALPNRNNALPNRNNAYPNRNNAYPNRNAVGTMQFSALGNLFLLDYPYRQVIECSRTMTSDQLSKQLQEAMDHAENGAITYSAAINDNEKKIVRAIREAGYPIVILLKDGFPKSDSEHEKYYKPGGVYFDACAKGKLLLLEPTEQTFLHPAITNLTQNDLRQKAEAKHHTFEPLPTSSLRYRYVALNNIAHLLCQM